VCIVSRQQQFVHQVNEFRLFSVDRFSKKVTHESDGVPGFTAVRSATANNK